MEALRRSAGRVIAGSMIAAALPFGCADAPPGREEPTRAAAQTLAWGSSQTLLADDAELGDGFGWAVGMTQDWAVIGALWDDDFGSVSGSAYFLSRDEAGWTQQQKVHASDARMLEGFGSAVAIQGDNAIIASAGGGWGTVYVFSRFGSTWIEQQKLVPGTFTDDAFGSAVALDGNTAVVGAPANYDYRGLVYVFTRTGETWSAQELSASDGSRRAFFGTSVAVLGDVIWVGATGGSANPGKVYRFVRVGESWEEKAVLTPDGGTRPGDSFGSSLRADADTLLVGSPGEDDGSGAAYVFFGAGDTWNQQARLSSIRGRSGDYFGRAVALEGDLAIVGADGDDTLANWSGAAYVFARANGAWALEQKILSPTAGQTDVFGFSAGLAGGRAIVGAYGVDVGGAAFAIDYGDHAIPCSAGGDCAGAAGCGSDDDCSSAGTGAGGEGNAGRPTGTAGLGGMGGTGDPPEVGQAGAGRDGSGGGRGGEGNDGDDGEGARSTAGSGGNLGEKPEQAGSAGSGGRFDAGGTDDGVAGAMSSGAGVSAGDSDAGGLGGEGGVPSSAAGRLGSGGTSVRSRGCGCEMAPSPKRDSTWLGLAIALTLLQRRRATFRVAVRQECKPPRRFSPARTA